MLLTFFRLKYILNYKSMDKPGVKEEFSEELFNSASETFCVTFTSRLPGFCSGTGKYSRTDKTKTRIGC